MYAGYTPPDASAVSLTSSRLSRTRLSSDRGSGLASILDINARPTVLHLGPRSIALFQFLPVLILVLRPYTTRYNVIVKPNEKRKENHEENMFRRALRALRLRARLRLAELEMVECGVPNLPTSGASYWTWRRGGAVPEPVVQSAIVYKG